VKHLESLLTPGTSVTAVTAEVTAEVTAVKPTTVQNMVFKE
jgi:hypothetical protein